jgi:hypothetical protein
MLSSVVPVPVMATKKPISLTLLTVTGAVSIEGGPNLAYVATNLTIG